MDLLPGSYARLAGVQSEVNKRTITRVASNEVEYRRCLDSYRKDMCVNINHIKREEVNLRRSLMRYSRALKKHKRDKSRRIRYERNSGFPAKVEQAEKSQSFALPDVGTSTDVVRRKGSFTNSSPDSILPQLQAAGLKPIPEHQVDSTGTASYGQSNESVADLDKPKFAKRKLSISTLQNQASNLDCQISEMSRSDSKTRIPDTRDNPHFRGVHGEVFSPVSTNMIRTAAVIYTIKHGYDGKPAKTAPIAPTTDARSHKKSRRHWESIRKSLTASKKVKPHLELSTKSMLCFPHLVQEITRLKAAGKLQNGFQNAHVESMTSVKRRECHDAAAASRKEVAKLHALDAGPSALHGVWNGQMTWHTSGSHQMKYRSGLPFERGTNGHKKLSAKMAGDTGSTKVGWQSALQKLKMVHTLS